MARPLKIRYSGLTAIGMQEMSDAEIDYTAHQICQAMSAQTNAYGPLTLGVNTGSGTSIGAFVDTWRPNTVGSHPVGTSVNSSTYTFYQQRYNSSTAPVRPVDWSSSAIREMNDSSLNSFIFNRVIARLSGYGLGSYVLQSTAPAGGTWTNVATITDTAQSGNTITYLWRKTSDTAPTSVRPLKVVAGGTRESTDADLQTLFGKYTEYVNSTGVGSYAIQESAPVGGTWVRMGNAFSDTRQQLSNINYTGYYSASYANTFSAGYAGAYASAFAGNYTGYFAGSRPYNYVRYWSGYNGGTFTSYYGAGYATGFTGYYTGYFTGYYAGSRTYYYAGSRANTYTGLTVISTKETPSNISLWLRIA